MDLILVKIFATALALSEVMTQPQAVKTHFDAGQDQAEVVQILRNGCAHMRQAFDIESINLDSLIATALDDPKALGADIKAFHGINFADLNTAYLQFCKNESVANPVVDLGQVIEFFNNAAADLPDQTRLKGRKLPSMSVVLDGKGGSFADVFEPGNRRVWVPLVAIPDFVQKAFVAAEDRRFFQHHGVDERGIIRAFIGNLADPGRPQGGSTITQQLVKNLLVGEDVTYERKIREMIVASRLENTMSKPEILELYLNSAYLGRGSWGVEMAARSYFGKSAKDLTLADGAMLAGLLKGPNYFNPDRHPGRAKERLAYVIGRMQEDGVISGEQKDHALAAPPKIIAFERPHRDSGFHFVDFLGREAKSDGVENLTADSYTVHSTINATLQRDTEAALQEGLAHYEIASGRMLFRGAEANIADAIQKLTVDKPGGPPTGTPTAAEPPWQQALAAVRLPLYDVHWLPAVVLDKGGKRGDGAIRVGLVDGRVLPLNVWNGQIRRSLGLYDVVFVHVTEGKATAKTKAPAGAQAQLRVRPTVQGGALVLENKTGRILAMAGSFSYPLSQLNRTSQTQRQPGSAIKPMTYLTALQKGLQPNTLVLDQPITLPPIGSGSGSGNGGGRELIAREFGGTAREEDFWSPRNANYGSGGVYTLRRGLENSVNVVTAHLLDGGIDADPEKSLDEVCATAVAAKIYSDCIRYYPFVLGAQPVRMIDLAAFYAAVANEGARPQPHGIDAIEENGRIIYEYPKTPPPMIGAADRASFYQLKTMLQGVVERGTARAIKALSPYVAGKTGTTEDAVDGWFIGFTNDVTVAVWVGYDNGDGKRRSLGASQSGARVALPIFEPIMAAIWAEGVAPKTPLSGPSREAQRQLIDLPIDYMTGDRLTGGRGFVEHFRLGADGRFNETQYQLVSRQDAYASSNQDQWGPPDQGWGGWGGWGAPSAQGAGRSYYPSQDGQPPQPRPLARGLFAPWSDPDDPRNRARRDPDYFIGGRVN
ncbi:MAG TPA: transglycosylase domain-containing protein [Xanthobacteraceae bacterium]|nr:transglycosylase domain-containing protein [Xanthobacteraceae bacterium]